jgi:WD40 repeat protein
MIRIWDVAASQVISTFAGHSDLIYDLAWSSDSRRIVSGGTDGMLKISDALSGEELFNYQTLTSVVNVDWSPTGEYVGAAAFSDPVPLVLRAWESTEELIAYAKECCVWRDLTSEERIQFGLPIP